MSLYVNIFCGCTDDDNDNNDDYDDDTSEQRRRRYKMHTFFRNAGIIIMLCTNVCNVALRLQTTDVLPTKMMSYLKSNRVQFFFIYAKCLFLSVSVYMMIPKWKVVTETVEWLRRPFWDRVWLRNFVFCHFRHASKWSAEQMTFNHETWLLLPLRFYFGFSLQWIHINEWHRLCV